MLVLTDDVPLLLLLLFVFFFVGFGFGSWCVWCTRYMNARNVLKDVKAGVTHLAHLLGFDDMDIQMRLGNVSDHNTGQQVDDADVPRLQALVEEKALELLRKVTHRGSSKPGSKRSQRARASTPSGSASRPTSTRPGTRQHQRQASDGSGSLGGGGGSGSGGGGGVEGDNSDGGGVGTAGGDGVDLSATAPLPSITVSTGNGAMPWHTASSRGGRGGRGGGDMDAGDAAGGPLMPVPGAETLGPAGTFGADGLGLPVGVNGHVSMDELRKPSSADNVFVPSRRRRRAREMALALLPDSEEEEEESALKELKRRGSIIDTPLAPVVDDDVSAAMHRRAGHSRSGLEVPPNMESFDLVQAANYIGMGMGVTMERQRKDSDGAVPPGRRVKPRIGVLAPGTIEAVTNKDKVASRTQMKQLSIAVESKHLKKKRNARPDNQDRRPKSSKLSEHA